MSEEKVAYALDLYTLLYSTAVRVLKEKFGNKAIFSLKEELFERGKELAKQEIERLGIKEMNARGYHRIVEEALKAFNIKYEVVELSDERYILRIYDCPHGIRFKRLNAPPEVCDALLELDRAIVQTLNPNLEFKLTKHILRGDEFCEYQVMPRKGTSKRSE